MSSKRQQQPSKSLLETDNEMKLLHLSVASQKIENQHKETLDALKRNSQRLPLFHNKLKQIKQQIEDAIATQDFDLAQQHKQQRDRLQGHLQTCLLASDLWSRIGHETTQRHGLIDQRLTCFRSLKQERARQLAQYNSNSRLQDRQSRLDKSRADLQQERSELSFDLDLYRQNLSDLASQMEEAVQAETEQRAALLARSDELGRDIDALRAELERLEGERREVLVQVDEVDADIKSKLDVFQEEQDHLKSEKKMIEERQQELKEKTENLDKEDEQIEREMKWHRDETRRRQEELDEFEKEIDALMDKQTKEDEENEVIRDITQLVYQHQDAKLTEYRDSLKEDRALLESKKKKLELIQKRVWETQERASQWQETVTKQTQRLKSLTKLQEMAIQNDDFETAAKLARDIKLVRIEDAKQTRNDVQEEARQLEDQLDKTTIELSQLKIDLSSKREHFGQYS
ncbi:MAG: hypothetical protein EXX96DRAFT_38463 [Benjaminiella poitrasii]|nr:MAG: hypothetical protein EXX96DRAFT_38463 [Benjaminiella poitrasii]